MGAFALILLLAAIVVVLGAEWPRIARRVGADARLGRARRRRKERLVVIEGDGEDDDFAASVERDLAQLPVTEERNGHSRR